MFALKTGLPPPLAAAAVAGAEAVAAVGSRRLDRQRRCR
jgi:hypothetical protein